jgi:hypothetical protein
MTVVNFNRTVINVSVKQTSQPLNTRFVQGSVIFTPSPPVIVEKENGWGETTQFGTKGAPYPTFITVSNKTSS